MSDLFVGVIPNNFGGIVQHLAPGANNGPPNGSKGTPAGLIDFNGEQTSPEVITLSLFAFSEGGNTQGVGPIIGMLSFGAGGGQNQYLEFDIPALPNLQGPAGVGNGGGVQLAIPCSHFNLGVRNDGFVTPPPAVGVTQLPLSSNGFSATVMAEASTGNRPSTGKVYRNVYGLMANVVTGLAPGQNVLIPVPAFATAYRVLRQPSTAAVTVSVNDNSKILTGVEDFVVAVGANAPLIDLAPGVTAIFITNNGPGNLSVASILFSLGI